MAITLAYFPLLPFNGAADNAPGGSQPINNSSMQISNDLIIDPSAIAQDRQERWERLGWADERQLNSVPPERVLECIATRRWYFNDPYKYKDSNVTTPENFIDIVARGHIRSNKTNDKFMPTKSRIDEYKAHLMNPDTMRNNATWRHYTKSTFEYFQEQTKHPKSRKLVQGLYKKLSADEEKHCENAIDAGIDVPAGAINWEEFGRNMSPYMKTFYAQSPVTPFEDSFNIIVEAHLATNFKEGEARHCGRDATFGRVTHRSCSITKEVVFMFLRECPGCEARSEKCSKARVAGIETQKRNEAERSESGSPRKRRRTSGNKMSIGLPARGPENETNENNDFTSMGNAMVGAAPPHSFVQAPLHMEQNNNRREFGHSHPLHSTREGINNQYEVSNFSPDDPLGWNMYAHSYNFTGQRNNSPQELVPTPPVNAAEEGIDNQHQISNFAPANDPLEWNMNAHPYNFTGQRNNNLEELVPIPPVNVAEEGIDNQPQISDFPSANGPFEQYSNTQEPILTPPVDVTEEANNNVEVPLGGYVNEFMADMDWLADMDKIYEDQPTEAPTGGPTEYRY